MKTVDEQTGKVFNGDPTTPVPIPSGGVPSMIPIPHQLAVTVTWVALGFGICWWLMKSDRRGSRNDLDW